ncbi:serpin family protein [Thermococcus indicus]|uniref:Serpin family protein n=1 Tax=Thermococcus indicus TaxID=2586643 RepID=A0A4Y5SIN9_9EURY|nr:serpin family protein [Thermococcus indicus]QDA30555.1 serpin family protein [Thermococcus indicus]
MRYVLAAILIFIVVASGCIANGGGGTSTVPPDSSSKTFTPPMTKYDVLEEGQERPVVEGLNAFAFELYRELSAEGGNVFFSPYSVEVALAMAYEGANGTTREEMEKVLHLPGNDEVRWTGFRYLVLSLNPSDGPYVLSTANALWVQKEYPVNGRYLWIIREFYTGDVRSVDFVKDPDGAAEEINRWAEEQTRGRIRDLIPRGALNEYTRLVITNAIYFKANWSSRFDPRDTANESFTLASGEKITAPMMHQRATFNYTENDELQALEMPYEGGRLSMLIILPRDNSPSGIEGKLTPEFIRELRGSMKPEFVDVTVPKFRFEKSYSLKKPLIDMGMEKAFSDGANFSGITDAERLFISDVIHKTFISVAENGTEAAAATAVIVFAASAPREEPEYKVFRADHPFLFLIIDRETGAVLFMGRLVDPRE